MTKKIQSRGHTPKVNRTDSPTAAKAGDDAPRTAFDLCELVAQHIEEEPRRYNQGVWMVNGRQTIKQSGYSPAACNTMACRAGWIVALHDGLSETKRNMTTLCIAERAREILGMTRRGTIRLFAGSMYGVGAPGTAEYAAAGARGIRAYAKRHAARLKSRLLKDVPKLAGAR